MARDSFMVQINNIRKVGAIESINNCLDRKSISRLLYHSQGSSIRRSRSTNRSQRYCG